MKHLLLTQLNDEITQMIGGFQRPQALILSGLSISRLWCSFEKWALQHKAKKLREWGKACIDILWEQITLNQLYGTRFKEYDRYFEKINAEMERFDDIGIFMEESFAYPLTEALMSALGCFFDPRLLPGLDGKDDFWGYVPAVVGQGAQYIYDDIFSNAGEVSENELSAMVTSEPRWIAELGRIREDISFLKLNQPDMSAILKRREEYLNLDIFS